MDKIKNPVKYKTVKETMDLDEASIPEIDRFGFIAQELEEVFPELVDVDKEGYLNIDYIGLIPIMVEAIKELQAKVETIENDCCASGSNLKAVKINSSTDSQGQNVGRLYQNKPNPFTNETIIQYEIPKTVGSAQLYIFNMNGTLLKTFNIEQRGLGELNIQGSEFIAGMYLYSLLNDGKIIDTKQMILTN